MVLCWINKPETEVFLVEVINYCVKPTDFDNIDDCVNNLLMIEVIGFIDYVIVVIINNDYKKKQK